MCATVACKLLAATLVDSILLSLPLSVSENKQVATVHLLLYLLPLYFQPVHSICHFALLSSSHQHFQPSDVNWNVHSQEMQVRLKHDPVREWQSIVMRVSISLFVCLSACSRAYLRYYRSDRSSSICLFMYVAYDRGSVLLWRRCDVLRISGFMDDISGFTADVIFCA